LPTLGKKARDGIRWTVLNRGNQTCRKLIECWHGGHRFYQGQSDLALMEDDNLITSSPACQG
jgi:hypothetical protein